MPSKNFVLSRISRLKEARQNFLLSIKDAGAEAFHYQYARRYAREVLNTLSSFFSELPVPEKNKWAVAAVGGFGRGEMSFYSDIDILFLYEKRLRSEYHEYIQSLTYGLWDANFEIGHNTCSINAAISLATKDFTVLTSHITSKFVAGSDSLYQKWRKRLLSHFTTRKKKNFIKTVKDFRLERYRRFGESSYLLEPHVKEGPGCLRDLHIIRWCGTVFWNCENYSDIPEEYLPDYEETWLKEAEKFLWEIRLRLHALNGKHQDQLRLIHQEVLSQQFLSPTSVNTQHGSVEALMEKFYRHTARVRRVTSFFLERIEEKCFGKIFKRKKLRTINNEFILEENHIKFKHPESIEDNPLLLLKIFSVAVQKNSHFHHETGQIIRNNLSKIDNSIRSDKRAANYFFDVLCNTKHGLETLRAMLETGLLTAYIPELKSIRYKVQYDVYHLFTVDEHLMRTVGELHKLISSEQLNLMYNLTNRDKKILLLAALLHDIGKGKGKGHSKRGAKIAKQIATRLGFEKKEVEEISFLIEQHLLLAEIALKRDLSDEKPIVKCATIVKDIRTLTLLYLLTIADSRATGPRAWNTWRASLLSELYSKTCHILNNKDWQTDLVLKLERNKDLVLSLCEDPQDIPDLKKWLENLSHRYLVSQKPENILKHYYMEKKLSKKYPLIFETRQMDDNMWEIVVVTFDKPGLFSIITGVLWAYGINILAADIFTRTSGIAVDILTVNELPDPLNPGETWSKIEHDLKQTIADRRYLKDLLNSRKTSPYIKKTFIPKLPDRIEIDESSSDFYTIIEVYTWDRPGILHAISDVFYNFGISIQLAKISTPGAQVVDIFYVTDLNGEKLYNDALYSQLKKAIFERLKNLS